MVNRLTATIQLNARKIFGAPFQRNPSNVSPNIPKVYVCREPEKIFCKEIRAMKKDLKRYEVENVEEGDMFWQTYDVQRIF